MRTRGGRARTPSGWKRLQDRLWCPVCKRQRFVLRAVAVPISGPSDATWPELRVALHAAFGETTRCANWLVTQLYARDRPRQPGDRRLARMRPLYLYPEARALFPALASQTLASLEQQVQARYRAVRLDLVWRHGVSLPTYRYPMPLPLPARMWDLAHQGERWHFSARIGDRRWSLRLRQGPGFARQIRAVQQIAAGLVEAGEATLYEVPAHDGDHRSGSAHDRRLMLKLAVWLARREPSPSARHTLIVRTAPDAFLTTQIAGRADVARLNADHVRGWMAMAMRRRQRLAEDSAHLGRLAQVQPRTGDRLRRRLDTWTHQATAQLVASAQRQGVRTIVWDDAARGYLPTYPWHRFMTTLMDKAGAVGIEVIASRPDAIEGSATSRPKPEQGPVRMPAGTASGNAQKRRGFVDADPRAPGGTTHGWSSRDAAVEPRETAPDARG